MNVSAVYYDGQSARDRQVTVTEDGTSLTFSGVDTPETLWTITGLHPVDPPSPGQPYRLTHDDKPGARLIIRDESFVNGLVAKSSHLKGGYSKRDVSHIFGWTFGGLAAVGISAYLFMSYLPQHVAPLLSTELRNRLGKHIESTVVARSRVCSTAAGDAAMGALIANLAEGTPDLPPIAVHVYDVPILNAFAVPGGSIIMTRELIAKADAPDEVAGVLAHEIGHVAYLHPEAQLVRLSGMEVLGSVFTGSNGGNLTTNVAFLATLLRYSRSAEKEADSYARDALTKAAIDPEGLKRFFEKIMKIEGEHEIKSGPLAALGSLFATHPGTDERIKEIKPLPAGVVAKPALTDEQWKALKSICG
jgi:Zn-dependent protease with chaperone function